MSFADSVDVKLSATGAPETLAQIVAIRDVVASMGGQTAAVRVEAVGATVAAADLAAVETVAKRVKEQDGTVRIAVATSGAQETVTQLDRLSITAAALRGEGSKIALTIAATGGAQTEEQLTAIAASARDLAGEKGRVVIALSTVGAAETEAQIAAIAASAADLKGQNIAFKIDNTGAAEAAVLAKEEAATRKETLATQRAEESQIRANARAQAEADAAHDANLAKFTGAQPKSIMGVPTSVAAPAALALGTAEIVKQAADLQTLETVIQNNTGMTDAAVAQMDTGIRDLAAHSNATFQSLGEGWQHVANFGFQAADATKIVSAAMESATSTGADTANTSNVLASALHQYKMSADEALPVANLFHLAAQQGNETFDQFAQNAQRAISIGAGFHIPLDQVAAALSALTKNGYTADEAQTQLVNILTHTAKPAADATKELERLQKATSLPLVQAFTPQGLADNGLTGTIDLLRTAYEKLGLTEAQAQGETMKLLNAQRGGLGMAALLTHGYQDYTKDILLNADAMSGKATPVQEAYAKSTQTLAYQVGELRNQFKLAAADDGGGFLAPITNAVSTLAALPPVAKDAVVGLALAAVAIKAASVAGDLLTSSTAKLGATIAGNATVTGDAVKEESAYAGAMERSAVTADAEAVALERLVGAKGASAATTASVTSMESTGAAATIGGAVAGIGKTLGRIAVPVAITLVAYDIIGKPAEDAIRQKASELERPQVDLSTLNYNSKTTFEDGIKARLDKQQKIVDEYNNYKGSAGYKVAKIENLGGELQSDRDYKNAITNIQTLKAAEADYQQTHNNTTPFRPPLPSGYSDTHPDIFIGPKELTDDEQATLIEHQSLVDQKRAELAAKGAPQRLIDLTTDGAGVGASKAQVASATVDLTQWTKIYADQLALKKQAIQDQLTVDKEAARARSDTQIANATAVETALKSAATAATGFDKKLDAGSAFATLAAGAESLDKIKATLDSMGQDSPHLDGLVAVADSFAAITKAEDDAKAAYLGYMLTTSETDKNIQFVDAQKKRLDDLVVAAQEAVARGTATPDQVELLKDAPNITGHLAQMKADLQANETGDFLGVAKHLPDLKSADDLMRSMVNQAGGGQQVLLHVQSDADKAATELTTLEKAAHETTLTIKTNAKEIQDTLTEVAKDREANLKVHVAWVDPQGKSVDPYSTPYANGAAPTSDGYTNTGTSNGAVTTSGSTMTPRGDATALLPYAATIKDVAKQYGVDPATLGEIIMHESGGVPGAVQSNGLGRGLGQLDIGQNPNYNESKLTGTSPDDIRYQIEASATILRNMIAARGPDEGVQGYAGPAYQSQATPDVQGGLRLPDELNRYYKDAVDRVLNSTGSTGTYVPPANAQTGGGPNGNGFLTPTGSGGVVAEGTDGGASSGVVSSIRQQIVDKALQSVNTDHLANLCETFVEETVQAITGRRGATGKNEANASVGFADAAAMGLETKTPQKGDLVYYPNNGDGHVAIYMGDGQQISTADKNEQGVNALVHTEAVGPGARYITVPGLPNDASASTAAAPIGTVNAADPTTAAARAAAAKSAETMPLDDPARDPKIVQIYDATKQVRVLDATLKNLEATGIGRATSEMGKFAGYAKKTYEDLAATGKLPLSQAGVTAVEQFKAKEEKYQTSLLGPKATDIQKQQAEKRVQEATQTFSDAERKREADATANEATLNFGIAYARALSDIKQHTGNISADYEKIRAVGGPIAENAIQWLGYEQKIVDATAINVQAKAEIQAIDDAAAARTVVRQDQDLQIAAAARTQQRAWQDDDLRLAATNLARDRTTENARLAHAVAVARQTRALTIASSTENIAYTGVSRGFQDRQRALQFSQQVEGTDLQNKLTDTQKSQQSTVWQRTSAEQLVASQVKSAGTNQQAGVLAGQLAGMHDADLAQRDANTRTIDGIQLQIREEQKKANLDSYNLQTETIAAQRAHEDTLARIAQASQKLTFAQEDTAKRQAAADLTLRRNDQDAAIRLAAYRLSKTRGDEDAATALATYRRAEDEADRLRKLQLNETIKANDTLITGWKADQAALDAIMTNIVSHLNDMGVAAGVIGSATGTPNTQQPVAIPAASQLTGANEIRRLGVPGHADGTAYSDAGLATVNERGGELRVLQSGEAIIPADATRALLRGQGGQGGGMTFQFGDIHIMQSDNGDAWMAEARRLFEVRLQQVKREVLRASTDRKHAMGA